jgi:hypothetical protein
MTDVRVINNGSIWTLNFLSEAGRQWRDDHLPDDAQTWGPNGVVVELRYLRDIVEGMNKDGLEVRG